MITKDIEKFALNKKRDIFFEYDIKKLNWFNIGGKTKIFFKPQSLKDLVEFFKLAVCSEISAWILSNLSNTILIKCLSKKINTTFILKI